MQRFGHTVALSLIGVILLNSLGSRAAARVEPLVADLEGVAIPATQAGEFYCHDFDHPLIRCFRTPARLEEAVTARSTSAGVASDGVGALGAMAVAYVRIFDGSSFTGTYAYLSQDYANLGSIGWNDRISSYQGVNSETGGFYTGTSYSGTTDYFCCNESVSSLGSLDNSFSSARRT